MTLIMGMKRSFDAGKAMGNKALADALKAGLLAAGVGAAIRGGQGLYNLARRNAAQRPGGITRGRTIDVPVDEEEEKVADVLGAVADFTEPAWGPIVEALKGNVSRSAYHPLAIPATIGAAGLGGYGGYKLTDLIMNQRRRAELKSELERSKREYEEAISGGHKISSVLDELFDAWWEKAALTSNDVAGVLIGGGITGAGLLALGSGVLAYDMTKKKNPAEVLRKAKQRRRRALQRRSPPPIFARPSRSVPTEDEMEGEPLDKVAVDAPSGIQPIPVHSKATRVPETPDYGHQSYNPLAPGSESNNPGRTQKSTGLLATSPK